MFYPGRALNNPNISFTAMKIPITILGGSDHRPGPLPEGEKHLHSIGTCKGVDVKIGSKSLVEHLVDSFNQSGKFGPISIAGPLQVYQPLQLDVTIVDTDGSVGENLEEAIKSHTDTYGPSTPMAVATYDIVLQPSDLVYLGEKYALEGNTAFWMPLVSKPDDKTKLGAFEWKPTYQLKECNDSQPIDILPGHLAIFTPESIDWPLLFRLLNFAYESRNHNITERKRHLVKNVIRDLVKTDFRQIRSRRLPHYTFSILKNGLRLASKLRHRQIVLEELQSIIGAMFLRRDISNPGTVRFPLVNILALAEDVDTEEEAADVARMHPEYS